MEPYDFETLFGTSFLTALVTAKDPPPAKSIMFKVPMRIVERVINNRYSGDGNVHPADHLLFIHELCGLFKIAGITTEQCKRKLFTISLKDGALDWYRLLKNADSFDWEGIVPLFHSKFYLYMKFIEMEIISITSGLMMEKVSPKLGGGRSEERRVGKEC